MKFIGREPFPDAETAGQHRANARHHLEKAEGWITVAICALAISFFAALFSLVVAAVVG